MLEKSTLCRQILKVYDVVSPGLSKERALTQFELYSAEKQIFKQDFDMFLKTPSEDIAEDLLPRLASSRDLLGQICAALRHERDETFERMVFIAAEGELEKSEKYFSQLKNFKPS